MIDKIDQLIGFHWYFAFRFRSPWAAIIISQNSKPGEILVLGFRTTHAWSWGNITCFVFSEYFDFRRHCSGRNLVHDARQRVNGWHTVHTQFFKAGATISAGWVHAFSSTSVSQQPSRREECYRYIFTLSFLHSSSTTVSSNHNLGSSVFACDTHTHIRCCWCNSDVYTAILIPQTRNYSMLHQGAEVNHSIIPASFNWNNSDVSYNCILHPERIWLLT